MSLFDKKTTSNGNGMPAPRKKSFKLLSWVVIVGGFFFVLNFIAPEIVSVLLNILWILVFAVVIVFFWLGVLVVIGMRNEVSKILDVLLEGSLTVLDFFDFLKEVWRQFVETLKEFLIFVSPVFAAVQAALVYIGMLILFKYVGSQYDIVPMTVILTVLLTITAAFLTKPAPEVDETELSWKKKFQKRMKDSFADAFEVMIFVFFLTMDSTNVFFLPDKLNVLLHAEIGNYDLMVRSFVMDSQMSTTITIILIAVSSEIFRNIMRIVAVSKLYYARALSSYSFSEKPSKSDMIKDAMREGFAQSKDDILKFITFNTVLFAVFLVFPRLKLLTLAVASIASMIMDFAMPSRLTQEKGNDLISRLLAKAFHL